jgi:hypothetical protein
VVLVLGVEEGVEDREEGRVGSLALYWELGRAVREEGPKGEARSRGSLGGEVGGGAPGRALPDLSNTLIRSEMGTEPTEERRDILDSQHPALQSLP